MVKENFIIKTEVFMMVCGEKIKCTAKEFYIIHLENLLMTGKLIIKKYFFYIIFFNKHSDWIEDKFEGFGILYNENPA